MTQEEFTHRHKESWARLESALAGAKSGKRSKNDGAGPMDFSEFDRLYRLVCKHLALARQRLYGTDLVGYLNDLALRSNHQFYRSRRPFAAGVGGFILGGFPALVRAHRGVVLVSALLFVLPALGTGLALRIEPDLIHSMMDSQDIRMLEEMYEVGNDYRPRERAADSDFVMFGYYIMNNVGISFRTFAGGLAFGLGSMLLLLHNGMFFGAVSAHLSGVGYAQSFFPFVAGHSGPELIALVLAGAAGLNLGFRLLAPGPRTRVAALKRAASESVRLIYGVAGLLLIAAFLEAFWSPRATVPIAVKYAAGAGIWMITLLYLGLAGRDRES